MLRRSCKDFKEFLWLQKFKEKIPCGESIPGKNLRNFM